MMLNTKLVSESSGPMKIYQAESPTREATATHVAACQVLVMDDFLPEVKLPSGYVTPSSLLKRYSARHDRAENLAIARKKLASELYADEVTLRNWRMQRGWSQTTLAGMIGSKQSHIARIERGSEDLMFSTCQKLCTAFGVDMNQLSEALKNQQQTHLATEKK